MLINKISASERSRKFIKGPLLVGYAVHWRDTLFRWQHCPLLPQRWRWRDGDASSRTMQCRLSSSRRWGANLRHAPNTDQVAISPLAGGCSSAEHRGVQRVGIRGIQDHTKDVLRGGCHPRRDWFLPGGEKKKGGGMENCLLIYLFKKTPGRLWWTSCGSKAGHDELRAPRDCVLGIWVCRCKLPWRVRKRHRWSRQDKDVFPVQYVLHHAPFHTRSTVIMDWIREVTDLDGDFCPRSTCGWKFPTSQHSTVEPG